MVGHPQGGQRRLLAILLDPVHVSLSGRADHQVTHRHTHTTSAQREEGSGNEDRQEMNERR